MSPTNKLSSPLAIERNALSSAPGDSLGVDIEQRVVDDAYLVNETVRSFAWSDVTVAVEDRRSNYPKNILERVSGYVKSGEVCALMGPSGCGKTTLLNVLARRNTASRAKVDGTTLVNGQEASITAFREISSYVEQEDALIGSLTIRETMDFAARLAYKNTLTKLERMSRIESLLDSFGLQDKAEVLIGTPVRKGISGGQKRRVSVASQLVTGPKLLFLDEPTSGLDSAASREVISFVKAAAKRNNLIVIASIHQPSTSTFQLFDKLVLLSGGKSYYSGPIKGVQAHFESLGLPIPVQMNPAEFLLDIMNTDFTAHQEAGHARLQMIQHFWENCEKKQELSIQINSSTIEIEALPTPEPFKLSFFVVILALVHRLFIKSYRDIFAYGIRIAMYTGLAIMMGTVWLRLNDSQNDIQTFINAIFFGSAFMSFMAVAYVPSYLEDRSTFVKERANGLYGATAFMISNFLVGLPFLFFISVLFSTIAYWLSNFRPSGTAFMTWVMWLFLDLLAAESLVVFISSIFPVFVISLALIAFANGLWMSVGGFMVPLEALNVFWKYVFHYIDYQAYVFQGMMVNEFSERSYNCDTNCHCIIQTDLAPQCRISGMGLLESRGLKTDRTGQWVGILLAIILGYRLLGWVALVLRK